MASGVAATRLNVPEGTEQAQNQGDTGTTAGQEEHQNNGTTEGQQDQTTAQVNTEGQTQGAASLEERRSSNRNLLRRFLQEVDEDTHVTCFASTLPLLISSLLGQVQDVPPWCLHGSTPLHRLPLQQTTPRVST